MQGTPQSSSGPHAPRSRPSRFVDHMRQLFGEDPDPQFLEESWSVGVPVAIENLHLRRRQRAAHPGWLDQSGDERAVRELERMAAIGGDVQSFLEDRSQPIDRRYSPAWIVRAPSEWSDAPDGRARHETMLCMSLAHAGELLGVSPAASRESVRSAYRCKVTQCHPDLHQHEPENTRRRATEQLAKLNDAYRILCAEFFVQAA